jgi:copper chaperone CopZ
MKNKWFLTLLLSLCTLSGMAEKKKAVFTVQPKMVCTNCENKIRSNMRFEKGVLDVTPSAEKQTVVIQYNSDKTTPEKIIAGFKKIGYTATDVTGKESTVVVDDCCKNGKEDACCKKQSKDSKQDDCCKSKK